MTNLLRHFRVCAHVFERERKVRECVCVCVCVCVQCVEPPVVKDGEQNARCTRVCVDTLSSCLLAMCDKVWLCIERERERERECVCVCICASDRL